MGVALGVHHRPATHPPAPPQPKIPKKPTHKKPTTHNHTNSRPVKRIEDVARVRTAQFSEDAGPMAHPIRPDSYIKMDNFYTCTVYEKVG